MLNAPRSRGTPVAPESFCDHIQRRRVGIFTSDGKVLMAQLIKTSAYVRRDARGKNASSGTVPSANIEASDQAIWSKLKTAHTVESLAKTLDGEMQGDAPGRESRIENAMKRWLDQDL